MWQTVPPKSWVIFLSTKAKCHRSTRNHNRISIGSQIQCFMGETSKSRSTWSRPCTGLLTRKRHRSTHSSRRTESKRQLVSIRRMYSKIWSLTRSSSGRTISSIASSKRPFLPPRRRGASFNQNLHWSITWPTRKAMQGWRSTCMIGTTTEIGFTSMLKF